MSRPPEKYGIDRLRLWELQKFLTTDYDLCYLTDNDAYHDPAFVNVLKHAYSKFEKPVSLYNSSFHCRGDIFSDAEFAVRKTIPGISQLYDKKTAQKIVNGAERHYSGGMGAWDYTFIELAELEPVTTQISYVQHYGANGLHSVPGDYVSCVALNPSQHLVDTRDSILTKLQER